MTQYKSDDVILRARPEDVFDKLSNPANFAEMMQNAPKQEIPEEQREVIEKISVDDTGITVPAGPMGSMRLEFTKRRRPDLIRLEGVGSPIPLQLSLELEPEGDAATRARVVVDIEIPMMMRMMVNGPLTKMTNQIALMLTQIPF